MSIWLVTYINFAFPLQYKVNWTVGANITGVKCFPNTYVLPCIYVYMYKLLACACPHHIFSCRFQSLRIPQEVFAQTLAVKVSVYVKYIQCRPKLLLNEASIHFIRALSCQIHWYLSFQYVSVLHLRKCAWDRQTDTQTNTHTQKNKYRNPCNAWLITMVFSSFMLSLSSLVYQVVALVALPWFVLVHVIQPGSAS